MRANSLDSSSPAADGRAAGTASGAANNHGRAAEPRFDGGLVVKTVVGRSTAYDAVVGTFFSDDTRAGEQEVAVVTCGTTLRVYSTTPEQQQQQPQQIQQNDDNNDDNNDVGNHHHHHHQTQKRFPLLASYEVDGTVLHLGKIRIQHRGEFLVAILERMTMLFLQFSRTDASSSSSSSLTRPRLQVVAAAPMSCAVACRADEGNMIVSCCEKLGIVAVHSNMRQLQLFFALPAGGAAGNRSGLVVIREKSVRLGEQQVLDMAFLSISGGQQNSSQQQQQQQQLQIQHREQVASMPNLVLLYRDKKQSVHVSAYRVLSPDAISLVSRALVSNLERTATHIVAVPSSAASTSCNGFAVCGATQVTFGFPPPPTDELTAAAEDGAAAPAAASTAQPLNTNKTPKQLAAAASNNANNRAKQQSVTTAPAAPWISRTVGYYPETPVRVYFSQTPSAVCVIGMKQQPQAAAKNFVAIALQGGQVVFAPVPERGDTALSSASSIVCSLLDSKVTAATAAVAFPSSGAVSATPTSSSSLALLSASSNSVVLHLSAATSTAAGKRKNNAAAVIVSVSAESPPTLLIETTGAILDAAVTEQRPTTEMLAVCGSATDSTFCHYRSGAAVEAIAALPDLEGLCNVHCAANSTVVLDVATGLRMLEVTDDRIEEVASRSDLPPSSSSSSSLVLCRDVGNSTLVVTSSSVTCTNSLATATDAPSSWRPGAIATTTASGSGNAKIVAADLDPTSGHLVVAMQGGQFAVLRQNSENQRIEVVPNGGNTVLDLSDKCITCSAVAFAPGAGCFFYSSWGSPRIYVADASASSSSSSSLPIFTLPSPYIARSMAVLTTADVPDSGSSSSHLLLVIGTPEGAVFVLHLARNSSSSSSSSVTISRVDNFSTGSTPVSLCKLRRSMVFPPVTVPRTAILCCGEFPCYLTCSAVAASGTAGDGSSDVETELIHLALGVPLLAAAQLPSGIIAVVTQRRELQLLRPVSELLLHRNIWKPQRLMQTVTHVAHVSSQGVFAVALAPSLPGANAAAPTTTTTSSSAPVPGRIAILHEQQRTAGALCIDELDEEDRNLGADGNNNGAAARSGLSSSYYQLLANEVVASLACLQVKHEPPQHHNPHVKHHHQHQHNDAAATVSASSSDSHLLHEYLVAVTRKIVDVSTAGRVLLFHVRRRNDTEGISGSNNSNSTRYSLVLVREFETVNNSQTGVTSAFGHKLVFIVGGLCVTMKLVPFSDATTATNSSSAGAAGFGAGAASELDSFPASPQKNGNVEDDGNQQQQEQRQPARQPQRPMSSPITMVRDKALRVGLANTCISSPSPTSSTIFIGDALHSVSAVHCTSGTQQQLQQEGANSNNNNSNSSSGSTHLSLRARDVSRRRIVSLLALDEETAVAGDEAMNIILFKCPPLARPGDAATAAAARKLSRCDKLYVIGCWHIGDRVTTLSLGSALSGGYTPGKYLLSADEKNADTDNEYTEQPQQQHDGGSDAMSLPARVSTASFSNNFASNSESRQRMNQLLIGSDYGNHNNKRNQGSSVIVQRSIVAGTTCGAVLAIVIVDADMRRFFAAICNAVQSLFPDASRVLNCCGAAAAARSRSIFRSGYSIDEVVPSRAAVQPAAAAAAAMVAAPTSQDASANNSVTATTIVTAAAVVDDDVEAAWAFVDGDEVSRVLESLTPLQAAQVLCHAMETSDSGAEKQQILLSALPSSLAAWMRKTTQLNRNTKTVSASEVLDALRAVTRTIAPPVLEERF